MEEKDRNDYEEYKKRIIEYLNQVETQKEISEDQSELIRELDKLKKAIISKINKKYRNEIIIMGLVVVVRELFSLRDDSINPFEKTHFQEEINSIYKIIYEELKKTRVYFPNTTPHKKNYRDIKDRRRMIEHIIRVFGEDNALQFYKAYPIRDLLSRSKKEYLGFIIFILIGLVLSIGLASLIGYFAILFRNTH